MSQTDPYIYPDYLAAQTNNSCVWLNYKYVIVIVVIVIFLLIFCYFMYSIYNKEEIIETPKHYVRAKYPKYAYVQKQVPPAPSQQTEIDNDELEKYNELLQSTISEVSKSESESESESNDESEHSSD